MSVTYMYQVLCVIRAEPYALSNECYRYKQNRQIQRAKRSSYMIYTSLPCSQGPQHKRGCEWFMNTNQRKGQLRIALATGMELRPHHVGKWHLAVKSELKSTLEVRRCGNGQIQNLSCDSKNPLWQSGFFWVEWINRFYIHHHDVNDDVWWHTEADMLTSYHIILYGSYRMTCTSKIRNCIWRCYCVHHGASCCCFVGLATPATTPQHRENLSERPLECMHAWPVGVCSVMRKRVNVYDIDAGHRASFTRSQRLLFSSRHWSSAVAENIDCSTKWRLWQALDTNDMQH